MPPARAAALVFFFFFNDTATTEIYTLSLHDALPICAHRSVAAPNARDRAASSKREQAAHRRASEQAPQDRKSTRLNSSHVRISYAVFCLKKKKLSSADHESLHVVGRQPRAVDDGPCH